MFGMGCWQIGGPAYRNGKADGWAFISEEDVERIFETAINHGVRFFDTSYSYGEDGRSERLIGKYLSHLNDIQIVSKFGWVITQSGGARKVFNVDVLRKSLETSLKRLNRTSIDTLLLHGFPDEGYVSDDLINELELLKSHGVISHFGASPSNFIQVNQFIKNGYGDTLEWVYHLLDRRIESLFPKLDEKKIRLIVRSPLASGLIPHSLNQTVKSITSTRQDYSNNLPIELKEWFHKSLYTIGEGLESNQSLREIALRFFLNKPVFKVLLGMRTEKQVFQLQLAIQKGPLSVFEENKIRDLPLFYTGYN